jgi:murein DD-endopeptidase MepM/ murein hydrolase activator NlpD
MIRVVSKVAAAASVAIVGSWSSTAALSPEVTPLASVSNVVQAATPAEYFQLPLPSWEPHCLGFGSEWRYCNGAVLRRCSTTGAVWLHTGVDIKSGIQPVMAAANGVIIGYIVDSMFRGGVLMRHETSSGIVITQYWHVWPRPGFKVGTVVTKGEVFADIADMGSRTHFHFAVFNGDYEADAWRGALPPSRCDGFPAFPYKFVNATTYVQAHLQPAPRESAHHCRTGAQL